MANPSLVKSMVAEAAVSPYRVVKFGTADGQVIQGAAAGDNLIGVADNVGQATAGGRMDVIVAGIADAEAGAAIVRGARLTVDSVGRVVTAVATNGVIGVAMASAAALGDIIPINVAPSSF